MPEILTESFCERCGTRYTFESTRPKTRLKGVKVLSRGLKNFVLSDDTTMDEAMAAARSETDREVTAHQLDAFHKTFNFCMSCRQYTCPNCWNEPEARCLSCAPLSLDSMPATLPGLATLIGTTVVAEPATNGANGHVHDDAEPERIAAEPEALAIEGDAATTQATTTASSEKASGQTSGLLQRFRPGQNLDDELAAYERDHIDAVDEAGEPVLAQVEAVAVPDEIVAVEAEAAEPEPETIAALQVEAAAEPELRGASVAAAEPEPEPAAAVEPEAEPLVAFVLEPPAAAAAEPEVQQEAATPAAAASDVVEQPTWRITAPDADGSSVPPARPTDGAVPVQASGSSLPGAEPQWPSKPEWPASQGAQASAGLPFLGRPAQPQGGTDALWAASNQELVATRPVPGKTNSGIQPCISCGLSLSATAKFCRRCGTLQGG